MDTQEQYERALKRAKDEGIVICGDSVAPDGHRAFSVYNPKHGPDDSWYTVRLTAGRYTCNCAARVPVCKHIALVQDDQAQHAARKAADLRRWTVDNLAAARRAPFAQTSMWS